LKLSFSTRGWKRLSWDELVSISKEMHFQGFELYSLQNNNSLFDAGGPLHPYAVAATVRELRDRRLEIPCLDTALELTDKSSFDILTGLMDIAASMHVPYVSAIVKDDD